MLRYAKRVLRCSISTNVGCIPSADHPHCAPWPHCSQWAAHSHNAKANANANSMRPLLATRCTLRPRRPLHSVHSLVRCWSQPLFPQQTTIIPTTNSRRYLGGVFLVTSGVSALAICGARQRKQEELKLSNVRKSAVRFSLA